MSLTREDLNAAFKAYWDVKSLQGKNAKVAKEIGAKRTDSTRGGKQFNEVAAILAKPFVEAGFATDEIHIDSRLALPGYYRPLKQWDLVVSHRGSIMAAFELKALGNPYYSNNYNNRVEEALGTAIDTRQAVVDGRYGTERPWLGYLLMVEDTPKAHRKVDLLGSVMEINQEWKGLGYVGRLGIGMRRMLDQKLYDAACLLTSSKETPEPTEPEASVDWAHFSAAITSRISYLAELGIPKR